MAPQDSERSGRASRSVSRRRDTSWLAPILVVAALIAAIGWWITTHRTRVVFESDSDFARVQVLERNDGLRMLVTGEGRARQSAIYPGRPMHLELAYSRVGMIGLALVPPDARILFVGLGGGAMPMYARQVMPQARIDVVEIDPVIVEVAQEWFGFTPDSAMIVHTGDGRAFIEQAPPATYDLIVLDAFSDDEVPYSLTTREFLRAVERALTEEGVVVSNLWTRSPAYPSMLATYVAVFDEVHLMEVPQRSQRILVGGSGARPLDQAALVSAARELAERVDLGFDLPELVEEGYEPVPVVEAPVLEDRAAAQGSPISGGETGADNVTGKDKSGASAPCGAILSQPSPCPRTAHHAIVRGAVVYDLNFPRFGGHPVKP
ncbi:MAG TPA: fused MFS/spermidine synthase, partial [Longimicrobiales bacterium]|nr:fused MFS/spermidine synthase [Longimicrobiales bacterium]